MAKKSAVSTDQKAIERFLSRGVENVYPTREKLGALLASGKQIRLYLGIDPTGPTLHMGHLIPMRKIAELQKLGHKVILLIGDFTAMIGDPTDKLATRKQLTRKEVLANCKNYKKQASKFLSFTGKNAAEMKFNSKWLAKMSFSDVVELSAHFTVQQMSERDMFATRIQEGKPVYLHEFLYPLMQGYDSVAMDVDLEVGGNDQTFNMLAGRTLQREIKQREKAVLTCKLLADASGKKMGKTEGNIIALSDNAEEMYGKVMSWTDGMIVPGFELCTDVPMDQVEDINSQIAGGENPMQFKRQLAKEIATVFVSAKAAEAAADHFTSVHQKKELPDEIREYPVGASKRIVDVMFQAQLVSSKTEARSQIEQKAVKVNGKLVDNIHLIVSQGDVIQKGKRHFVKLV